MYAAALSNGKVYVSGVGTLSFTSAITGKPARITSVAATDTKDGCGGSYAPKSISNYGGVYALDGNTGELYRINGNGEAFRIRTGMVASHTGNRTKATYSNGQDTLVKPVSSFYQSSYVTNIVEIEATADGLILLHRSGEVFALGSNAGWQLGTGYGLDESAPYPVVAGATGDGYLKNVLTIAAGDQHAAAMLSSGVKGSYDHKMVTWGVGTSGQLGNNGLLGSLEPVYVLDPTGLKELSGVVEIYAGGNSTGAIVMPVGSTVGSHGTDLLYLWGSNANGQLGSGDNTNALLPIRVARGTSHNDTSLNADYQDHFNRAIYVSLSNAYAMGVQDTGLVFGWSNG